jgi:dynein heavy chain
LISKTGHGNGEVDDHSLTEDFWSIVRVRDLGSQEHSEILEKNFIKEAGVTMLVMGDQKIVFNEDFRMFLTTKISNPNYTPEIFGKTMIINFSVTMPGLRDQLLNEVVQYERPELEEARKKLVIETS